MANSSITLPHNIIYILLILLGLVSGCATPTTFRVLDAQTKKPIEGAVALAEWSTVRGFALTYTDTVKIVEVVSDEHGFLTLPTMTGRVALRKPHLKIYKAGYVGWDSNWIYLGCYVRDRKVSREIRREGFSMRDQDIYLEPWKDKYSFISHGSFIVTDADFGSVGMKESKYEKAIEYEAQFSGNE